MSESWNGGEHGDRLRIAVVGTRGVPSSYSGLERVTESLYTILAARGHEITVYCRPGYIDGAPGSYRGIRLIRIPVIRRKSIETLVHVGASLTHAVLRGHYDLVHLQALAPGLFAPLRPLWRAATVSTIHGLDWQRAKWQGTGGAVLHHAERSIVRHIDNVTVVSRDLQRYFRTTYGKETAYIPNGVHETASETTWDPSVLERFALTRGQYLVYVGRLVPEKRVHDLIRAYRKVDADHRLVLVGEGGYTDEYVAELRAIAADDQRVVFTGRQEGTALETVFSGAAAFVTPSELEGLPSSLLECMEYGVPAIASDIAPHRELLGGVAGYDLFFPATDVAALTERIQRVLEHAVHYRAVAERAQQFVRREYSWSAIADRTEELYREIVRRARSRTRAAARTPESADLAHAGEREA